MKAQRRMKIQALVTNEVIRTQEELGQRLLEEGYAVTQATISRDIKEIGLIKIADSSEEYRYAVSGEAAFSAEAEERLKKAAREMMLAYDSSENIIVIKTMPGYASALAALFDRIQWPEVIGSVAGDDTFFLLVKPKEELIGVLNRIKGLL